MDNKSIDKMLLNYVELKEQSKKLSDEADAILYAVDEEISKTNEETKGVFWLIGDSLKAKITRRLNVRYPDKDALADLLVKYKDEIQDFFRVEFKESAKINNFLDNPKSNKDKMIAEEIESLRVVSKGKPSMEILPHVN